MIIRRNVATVRVLVTATLSALLFGCGGNNDDNDNDNASTPAGGVTLQVVSFGDSLSDVGTYAGTTVTGLTRGRYTTNPGEVWPQKVAEYYGDTLGVAYKGGYGQALVAQGGMGYAQGGSRVVDPDGEGHGSSDTDASTTVPVITQVQEYLAAHSTFNSQQLVLINGGANDIFEQATSLSAAIAADVALGMTTQAAVTKETQSTLLPVADSLAQIVGTVLSNGATHVVVSNIPDIGQTPFALALGDDAQNVLTLVTQAFNTELKTALQSAGNLSKVVYIDAASWQDNLSTNYIANGYSVSNTATACNLTAMAAFAVAEGQSDPDDFASSLYCAPQFLTVANADQSYMYADLEHPSTHTHALFATYVEQQIAASGLGK